jgi:hypothetical protein
MDSTNKPAEMIVQQGKNVLASMKDLKRSAKKKGKNRSDLYQRLCANEHSFAVYTYMDAAITQSAEVQAFQQKVELFSADFESIRTNFDAEVDVKRVETMYEEVLTAYNAMVHALEFADEAVNVKNF